MGVYIKGMEMPTDCAMMLKIFPDGKVGVPVHLNWAGTMVVKDAEAVPVPPHGRLIDGDVAEAIFFTNEDADGKDFYDGILYAADFISKQPTIIEAEEGE